LDVAFVVLLVSGAIFGSVVGVRQAFALAAVLVGSLVCAIALAATTAWAVYAMVGGSTYFTRTSCFLGFFLGAAALGVRYAWNRAVGDSSKVTPPAFVNRPVGALCGAVSGAVVALFLLFQAFQVPAATSHLASLFRRPGRNEQVSPSLLRTFLSPMDTALRPFGQSLNPNPTAPLLVSAAGGRVAGDHYACYVAAFHGDSADDLRLYLNLGTLINFYSNKAEYVKNAWLAQSVDVLRAIQTANEKGVAQKASDVFLSGTLEEMDAMVCALSFASSPKMVQIRYDGDVLRRTLYGAKKYLEKGESLKAQRAYDAYLAAYPQSPFRVRVAKGRSPSADSGQTRPETPVRPVVAGRPETTGRSRVVVPVREEAIEMLKSYRYQAAAKATEALAKDDPESGGEGSRLHEAATRMAGLHRAFIAKLKKGNGPRLLPLPGDQGNAAVAGVFEGSVALKTGETSKTVAWKAYSPEQLLRLYEEVVPEEEAGIAAFKSFFQLR
jgi:hypothetical protein